MYKSSNKNGEKSEIELLNADIYDDLRVSHAYILIVTAMTANEQVKQAIKCVQSSLP